MRYLRDYRGDSVRLTPERLAHILTHPEMEGFEPAIEETVARPECVIESISDPAARLYYREYTNTRVGRKLLCVVVKVRGNDRFVVTAYLTDRLKRGQRLWPSEA